MFFALLLALVSPGDWVPARWHSLEAKSLELLANTPINCLLVQWKAEQKAALAAFASNAASRGVATLAVISPGGDPIGVSREAVQSKLTGVVLEGDFPQGTAERVRDGLADSKAPVIELTSRRRMKLGSNAPVLGTYQGVWPGIEVLEGGAAKAGPSGSPWINTNAGFLRVARAFGGSAIWIGNRPPPKMAMTAENYLQAIGDAAIVAARWIVALDEPFEARLRQGDPAALAQWKRIGRYLQFYEEHPEWRALEPAGKLAIVQDPNNGALLSGGILDMIAARHTPVRAVPPQRLNLDILRESTMAVDVNSDALTAQQKETLKAFTRSGGTLLTGPPGWKDQPPLKDDQITLDDKELKRLDDIWHDVQSMIGRSNLGARLFNVSSMLSNLLASKNGKEVVVHLVNYSSYPVESVTVHVLGNFKHARLYTPEGPARDLEVYKNDEGTGIDIDKVSVCATLLVD
jgi:hypothetical protein